MKFSRLISAALLICSFGAFASDADTSGFPADGKTLYIECRMLHDGQLMGAPRLLIRSGEAFKLAVGAEGADAFSLEGVSRVAETDVAVTDFTFEITHWAGPIKQTRRVTQAVRVALGKDFAMVEVPGENGGSDVLMFKVSYPDANTLKYRAQ